MQKPATTAVRISSIQLENLEAAVFHTISCFFDLWNICSQSSANLFVIDCITLIVIIKTFDSNHFATFDESFARDFPYFKSRE